MAGSSRISLATAAPDSAAPWTAIACDTASRSSERAASWDARLSSSSSRARRSSRSSSSERSSATAARSANTSMIRFSSPLNAGCGSDRAIASTPRIRPSRVRTGTDRNDDELYQSHSRCADSGSRRSCSRSCSPSAPGQSDMCSISTGEPPSIAASVTPARSGSYGRLSTGPNASRTSSEANHEAAGSM